VSRHQRGDRLAAISVRNPKRTLIAAGILLVLGVVVGVPVTGALSTGGFDDPHSQAAQANDRVIAATDVPEDSSIVVLVRAGTSVTSSAGRALVEAVADDLRHESQVALVVDPISQQAPQLVSKDGQSAYVVAQVTQHPKKNEDVAKQIAARVTATFPQTVVGGPLIATTQVQDQVSKDLGRAEMIAAPILFLVLVVVLRGVVVALLPLAAGGLSILTTFMFLRGVNAATSLSIFALNLVTGLGLGLAIDYGLLIVNRYR
jgi:putative drug exporter of the RND superfamily